MKRFFQNIVCWLIDELLNWKFTNEIHDSFKDYIWEFKWLCYCYFGICNKCNHCNFYLEASEPKWVNSILNIIVVILLRLGNLQISINVFMYHTDGKTQAWGYRITFKHFLSKRETSVYLYKFFHKTDLFLSFHNPKL